MAVIAFKSVFSSIYHRSLLAINGGHVVVISSCIRSTFSNDTTKSTSDIVMTESTDNEKEKHDRKQNEYEENIRKNILDSSLPFVHSYGWTKNAISAGAESLGYPGVIHGMFPRGGADLVFHFYAISNKELASQLKKATENVEQPSESTNKSSQNDPKELINSAVETRLRMVTPYLNTWPQALAIMTMPANVPTALANLLTLVDDICYYAGDRSVDFNWYTRRVALAGIYKMTELYMIQDSSPDHQQTWQFLQRRIEEASQLNSVLVQSEFAAQFAKEVASATFTTARNILGLNWNR